MTDNSSPSPSREVATTDLARAREIVKDAHDPAREAAYSNPVRQTELRKALGDSSAPATAEVIREIDERIRAITALAHSTKLKDEQEYMRLQPELMQLIEDRSALATGRELPTRSKARTGEPTLPAAGSSAAEIEAFHKKVGMPPASHIDYPDLPDDGRPAEQMAEDSHLWLRALPKLHKAGITLKQATALGEILREAEADSIAYRAEAAAQRHRDSERALKRLYGPGYGTEVAKANQYLRRVLPAGASRELAALNLADGSRLGDHELFVRAMVEFAKEAL